MRPLTFGATKREVVQELAAKRVAVAVGASGEPREALALGDLRGVGGNRQRRGVHLEALGQRGVRCVVDPGNAEQGDAEQRDGGESQPLQKLLHENISHTQPVDISPSRNTTSCRASVRARAR
jgi:hypothetical protein